MSHVDFSPGIVNNIVSLHGDVRRTEEVYRKTAEFLNVPACGACNYLWALNGEAFSE
jgi:hypothetical protein